MNLKSNLTRNINIIIYWNFLAVFEGIAALLSVFIVLCRCPCMLHKRHWPVIVRCNPITRKYAVVLKFEWTTVDNPSTSKVWTWTVYELDCLCQVMVHILYGTHCFFHALYYVEFPFWAGHPCSNNNLNKHGSSTYVCIQF